MSLLQPGSVWMSVAPETVEDHAHAGGLGPPGTILVSEGHADAVLPSGTMVTSWLCPWSYQTQGL